MFVYIFNITNNLVLELRLKDEINNHKRCPKFSKIRTKGVYPKKKLKISPSHLIRARWINSSSWDFLIGCRKLSIKNYQAPFCSQNYSTLNSMRLLHNTKERREARFINDVFEKIYYTSNSINIVVFKLKIVICPWFIYNFLIFLFYTKNLNFSILKQRSYISLNTKSIFVLRIVPRKWGIQPQEFSKDLKNSGKGGWLPERK